MCKLEIGGVGGGDRKKGWEFNSEEFSCAADVDVGSLKECRGVLTGSRGFIFAVSPGGSANMTGSCRCSRGAA